MKAEINKGPQYLEGLHEKLPADHENQWRGQLISSSGNRKFRIKYYGDLKKNWIIMTNKSTPQKVIAEDIITKESIILFDGSSHGYNGLFVDEYNENKLSLREVNKIYSFKNEDIFEIEIKVNYGIDYDSDDEDFKAEVDKNGMIELLNDKIISFEEAKRNGFDCIKVIGLIENGKTIGIISEELA